MKLVVLGYIDSTFMLPDQFRRNNLLDDSVIVSMNYITEPPLGLENIKIGYPEEFLEEKDYDEITDYTVYISRNWYDYLPSDDGISLFKDIKIAEAFQLEVYISLCTVIKNLHVVLNAIEKFSPSEVVLIGENAADGMKEIAYFLPLCKKLKSVYIKITKKQKGHFLKRISGVFVKAKDLIAATIAESIDGASRFIILHAAKYKRSIIADYRFPAMLGRIGEEHPFISYAPGKGLRLRLDLIKGGSAYFSFLKVNSFAAKMRGRRYFAGTETVMRKTFTENPSFWYRNFSIYGIVKDILQYYIEAALPLMRSNISMLYDFFKTVKPKAVIVRDSTRNWERALTLVAKSLDVPSIVIQHGITSIKDIYAKQHADAMAFWGDIYLEWYKSSGTDISRSRVTGYPPHDYIHAGNINRRENYANILRSIGADPDKKTVVYLASCIKYHTINSAYLAPDISFFLLKKISKAFEKFKDLQFIIKLHPFYDREEYPRFKKQITPYPNVFILTDAKIPDLFGGAVCIISELYSSAIMDAIILKKPVILFNTLRRKEAIPLEKRKVGFETASEEELMEALEKIIFRKEGDSFFPEDSFDKFINDFAFRIDGRSSERVQTFIKELISAQNET